MASGQEVDNTLQTFQNTQISAYMKSERLINTAIIILVALVVAVVLFVVVRQYVIKWRARKQKVVNVQGSDENQVISVEEQSKESALAKPRARTIAVVQEESNESES